MGSSRPINSDGDTYSNPVTYNPYDKGYKSGAQSSLFIGPIWIEEVVSIRIGTGTEDIPVYPYSTPYYNTILLGNYIINGQIGINFTESDYLLRIIDAARNVSIQDSELQALIQGRKSLFEDTLISKASNDDEKKRLTNYVERISREIETSSMASKGRLDPKSFELTIIVGNIYDPDQVIEIYEDVKINRTNKIIDNGDDTLIEIYDFIGKKKPDRLVKTEVTRESGFLSRSNLLAMTEELIDHLADKLTKPPVIQVTDTDVRTSEMYNTDQIGISGFLAPNTRCYGKRSSFSEIIYSYEYAKTIGTYPVSSTENKEITSDTKLKIYDSANPSGKEVDILLQCPKPATGPAAFDNKGGRIIFPDREGCSRYITAIAPIEKQVLLYKKGGSVILPRYNKKDFGIGSYYPPGIMDLTSFSYEDKDIKTLTSGTLWCSPLGFRSSQVVLDESSTDDASLGSITQPVNTMSLIEKPSTDWSYSSDTFTIKIPVPRTVDFVNADKGKLKSTKAMDLGATGNYLNFTMFKEDRDFGANPKDKVSMEGPFKDTYLASAAQASSNASSSAGSDTLRVPYTPNVPVNNTEIFDGTFIQVYHQQVSLPLRDNQGIPQELSPNFFTFEFGCGSERIASSTDKSLYIIPLIFVGPDNLTWDTMGHRFIDTPVEISSGVNFNDYFDLDPEETTTGKKAAEMLACFMKRSGGKDDSCKVDIVYDCVLTKQQGYFDFGSNLKIDGVYFINDIEGKLDNITDPDGNLLSRESDVGIPVKIHVFWITGIIPNLQLPTGVTEDNSKIKIQHDLADRSGRKLEIYNITRCDTLIHNLSILLNRADGLFDAIKLALQNAFSELLGVDKVSGTYTYPVKTSWLQYAGFISGYSFNIDIVNIVEQITKCTFTKKVADYINIPSSAASELTLAKAYSMASGTTDLKAEVTTMVQNIIDRKITELGGRITNRGASDMMNIEIEVLIPARDVVHHGLSKEGFEELKAFTALNAVSSNTEQAVINLGGYNV